MTNAEYIKSMNTYELAKYLNSCVSCSDYCDKFDSGCAWNCPNNHGYDVFVNWLNSERVINND